LVCQTSKRVDLTEIHRQRPIWFECAIWSLGLV
jgi:hypothetical protein